MVYGAMKVALLRESENGEERVQDMSSDEQLRTNEKG
jgi:hypothetical protein